ncbi:glycoside hydrolase family 31 protein [Russula earlei]|uniref:Glycoside hydrolase family 31 protein n=1 Tax=Russula earlei TaxID=71964 RepID=A0ACC0U5K0_9AGAM|nr:glycoside hydrolase family 31 protein [Russula earlei]
MLSTHRLRRIASVLFSLLGNVRAEQVDPAALEACPGYNVTNINVEGATLTARLTLAGPPCNVFGNDLKDLDLAVVYETETRIHLKITDAFSTRYEVPESAFPRPAANADVCPHEAQILFTYTAAPFSFNISRAGTGEVLFTTAQHALIFEPQYLRLKTALPPAANIYGLGEHTEPFRLNATNTNRTLWSRDAFGIPRGTNLYGNHPVYFEHRPHGGTHAVFLLSSNGMDVKIRGGGEGATTLEYNVIGGVFDFYFLAGSETDPSEVARQYAQIVGTPAEVPYWSFGLHQCRYGYQNYIDVADVVKNYSDAGIPLETMWTDIDYMFKRRVFTMDSDYFPPARMREIIDDLHERDQRYVLMIDPAVGFLPGEGYGPYDRGTQLDLWLQNPNGSASLGVVWPGMFLYWTGEFESFFDPGTGFDIDGAWIDMNDPASFCEYPCDDPFAQAIANNLPPPRTSPPPDPNAPIFRSASAKHVKRGTPSHADDDLLNPPYAIDNAAGALSSRTVYTNAIHANGLVEYDAHNLYGTMMSVMTHEAMLARRPGLRTLVITRSTFAGAGHKVGKWLGDNLSRWEHYRMSIAGMLGMAGLTSAALVSTCAHHVLAVSRTLRTLGENTTETLCARWAMLGAFYPFMRNHNSDVSISQEFYRWPLVTQAAKNALETRYRLLDYLYTAFHKASLDGSPVLNPLWFKYPTDASTFDIDLQFFFGDSILVSPVTEENATTVTIYLPKDRFYDFTTLSPVEETSTLPTIPLHIRGGTVLPLRAAGAMTTTELRATDFQFVVAPDVSGKAEGTLYVDDGVSVVQEKSTSVKMGFAEGELCVDGSFAFDVGVKIASVVFLGVETAPTVVTVSPGKGDVPFSYEAASNVLRVQVDIPFAYDFKVAFH